LKVYTLKYSQEINLSLNDAWFFFSSPVNLVKITPPYMGFKIISEFNNEKMFAGMIIQYIIKPILEIPMRWVTEITHVEENKYFIDEQRFGPYKFWHHLHRFEEKNGKLIMEDIVNYALPFGILGEIVNILFVGKKVREIFEYREKVLSEIFNDKKPG